MHIGKKKHSVSIKVYATGTLLITTLVLSAAIIKGVISLSVDAFIHTYKNSQEKVFIQIEKELMSYHEDILKAVSQIESSWAYQIYFDIDRLDSQLEMKTIYQMQKELEGVSIGRYNDTGIIILGKEGERFSTREEKILFENEEMFACEAGKAALEDPSKVHYTYVKSGYTSTTEGEAVIIASRALTKKNKTECYAVVFFTIKEKDFQKMYEYFTSEDTNFYLVNQNKQILSSDQDAMVGQILKDNIIKGEMISVLEQNLPSLQCTMYGVIQNQNAVQNIYDLPHLIERCVVIGFIVNIWFFLFMCYIIKPVDVFIKNMKLIQNGNFNQFMEVSGPKEVQQVEVAYNSMLQEIQEYMKKIVDVQNEKRKAEISALQMQINPHYMYNTLTSIKWLIWQGDTEKSVKTIDAFIELLRNTISNVEEYITVEQEIKNLENYVYINHVRYGDGILVNFLVLDECKTYLLPKMILQPFVENAFFHGFPEKKEGNIQISFNRNGDDMEILISDNGVGIKEKPTSCKVEHYSGIGISNVDKRLKLLYGIEYGVEITSKENEGTTVSLKIPIVRLEENIKN